MSAVRRIADALTMTAAAALGAVALTGPAIAVPAHQPPPVNGISAGDHGVRSMSAVNGSDMWAVGWAVTSDQGTVPLAEHWDGAAWQVTRTPLHRRRPFGNLDAVSAPAPDDVWAVGASSVTQYGSGRALAEHWNGKRWQVIPTNTYGFGTSELTAVTAAAPDDVWAVGYYYDSGGSGTVIEHWNGSAWTVVDHANPADAYLASLSGVSAVAADNVWAVGSYLDQSSNDVTLVEHWNGKRWQPVKSPNVQGASWNVLQAVSARSRNDVWATGSYSMSNQGPRLSLTDHWDGTQWSIVDSPQPPGGTNSSLYGVAALGADDVWAAGFYRSGGHSRPFSEHWNGTGWTVVDMPNPGGDDSYVWGVAALSADDVWAAGDSETASGDTAYGEHWDGTDWSLVQLP